MAATVSKAIPRLSFTSRVIDKSLFPVFVFSGVGLLASLLVVILDQHIPGDWF